MKGTCAESPDSGARCTVFLPYCAQLGSGSLQCRTVAKARLASPSWLAGELIVVFAGVSAAFIVENYGDSRNQAAEFYQALSGVIAELYRSETRGRELVADGISAKISEWEQADHEGKRAIPGYYRIPGATHPPSAAWNMMVTSGLARLIEPNLRTELGYFYSEFVWIHDNYERFNQFTEREVLPELLSVRMHSMGRMGTYCRHFVFTWTYRTNLRLTCASCARKRMTSAFDLKPFSPRGSAATSANQSL